MGAEPDITGHRLLIQLDDVRRFASADRECCLKMIAGESTFPECDDFNQMKLGQALPAECFIYVFIHINTRICLKVRQIVNSCSIA